jgi:putative flippase GtrA
MRVSDLRRQGGRFALVGATVAIVYTGLTAVLAGPAGLPFQAALAIGYGAGLALNFTLHRAFTFASEDGYELRLPSQIARFLALALTQYAVTAAAVAVLPGALGLPHFVVWAVVVALFAVGSFVALRVTTFHRRQPSSA